MLNLAKHVPWHMVLTSRVLGTARLRMAGPFVCATLPEDVATALSLLKREWSECLQSSCLIIPLKFFT